MEALIDRIEEKYAILKLANHQELKWPVEMLPSDYKVGMRVWLKLDSQPLLKVNANQSSKDLLNEILKEDSKVS